MSSDEDFFQWLPEYSVNVQTLDKQHRELVNILNRLFNAVSGEAGDNTITEILDGLVEYTRTHFTHEEHLMQKAKYAELEAHKLEHKRLVDQLDQLRKQHLLEEKSIYFELLSFLKKWLREHIMGVDTKYCLVLQQAGFSMAVSEHEASAEFRAMIEMTGRSWKLW